MLHSRNFSVFLGFSLLALSVISVNQADAQTIQLTSLKAPDCVPGGSANLPDCTSGARGSDLQEGTLLSLFQNGTLLRESLADSPPEDHLVNNQGAVEGVDIDLVSNINTGLVSNVGSFGATFQEPEGTTLNFGLSSDRHTVRSDFDQSLNNSNWSGIVVSLIDSPTLQTIASESSGQSVVSLIDLPTGETMIDSPTAETIASDSSGQSDALSPFEISFSAQPEAVPEPSISLLGWLGLGAVGLFKTKFKSKK